MKRVCYLLIASLLVMLTTSLLSAQDSDTSLTPLLIDTDMAADDWMAILYLAQRPDVELLGLAVTGAGEAHCDPGIDNALGLLALAGAPEVPVACGRETPLQGDNSFPDWLRDDVDAVSGLELPKNSNPPFEGTAVELLIKIIEDSPEPVILLTLGPLTNVAEALEAEPAIFDNIQMIYIMGGAVDVPGNVSFITPINRVAEANIYVDPHAAQIVFASGAPITLVSLDATNHVPLTSAFFNKLGDDRTTMQAEFVYQILLSKQDFIDSGGYFFWDPLAAAIAVDETLVTIEERKLTVEEEAGSRNGQILEADDGSPIRVAVSADGDRFETLFLNVLNGRGAED